MEPTTIAANIDDLRAIGAQGGENPASVNALLGDGPDGGSMQVVWVGTPSGLHRMDLISGLLTHGGEYEHPGIDGASVPAANEIHSLHSTGNELIIGSRFAIFLVTISKAVPCAGVVIGTVKPPDTVTPRSKPNAFKPH